MGHRLSESDGGRGGTPMDAVIAIERTQFRPDPGHRRTGQRGAAQKKRCRATVPSRSINSLFDFAN
jgi:hypothetical protein